MLSQVTQSTSTYFSAFLISFLHQHSYYLTCYQSHFFFLLVAANLLLIIFQLWSAHVSFHSHYFLLEDYYQSDPCLTLYHLTPTLGMYPIFSSIQVCVFFTQY